MSLNKSKDKTILYGKFKLNLPKKCPSKSSIILGRSSDECIIEDDPASHDNHLRKKSQQINVTAIDGSSRHACGENHKIYALESRNILIDVRFNQSMPLFFRNPLSSTTRTRDIRRHQRGRIWFLETLSARSSYFTFFSQHYQDNNNSRIKTHAMARFPYQLHPNVPEQGGSRQVKRSNRIKEHGKERALQSPVLAPEQRRDLSTLRNIPSAFDIPKLIRSSSSDFVEQSGRISSWEGREFKGFGGVLNGV